ncbi:MAG: lycopene beta-cyclase CrtY [Pseudomonadota bacterium]
MADFDVILVGGGLSAGLIADRLAALRPELSILILEGADKIAGNHTWSFHQSDVTPDQDRWLTPFKSAAWDGQTVHFPSFDRHINTGYRSVSSERFRDRVMQLPNVRVETRAPITEMTDTSVTQSGGQSYAARCVIDCRGAKGLAGLAVGYQKFFGLEVTLREPHGLTAPVIMDARVDQHDGYRFVYLLPFSATRLLIEDTYYADTIDIDGDRLAERCRAYAKTRGWTIDEVIRTEIGVLPILLDGRLETLWPETDGNTWANGTDTTRPARAGMRAGLFHQTTGYSLPLAARVADALAVLPRLTTANAHRTIRAISQETWRRQSYFRLLNRTMFLAGEPQNRRRIFNRFYKLGQPLIERFYAGQPTRFDQARLLTGKPPVPMFEAFLAFAPGRARPRLVESDPAEPPAPLRGGPRFWPNSAT